MSPFGVVFSKIFEELAGSQMSAFIKRAETLYG
jgi:ribosome-associated toxin RatA of RatAB toxin-antitoxin module